MGNVFMRHTANSRTITLIVVGLTYLFIGAGIFSAIERQNEIESSKELFGYENHFRTLYNISDADFENLTYVIMGLQPHKAGVQWSFVGSLYFAITVVTTIGYGHAVPQTTAGKLACIAYAVLGIPLCLVMFQAMGDRMNNSAKSMLKSAGRKLGFKFDEISHKCLIPFGILSCCVTVAVGSVAFSHFEGWSYLNSVYYCVMTLSTIGFGDYVALQADGALQQRPQYVAFSFIYILIGLTVIGAFLNLVILRLIVTLPMTPDGSTNGDQAVDFSSNSESGFQHHEFRRKVRKRRKKRSHQNIANTSSRSKWDKLFSFAKSRSVEETEEQSSIVPQDASSSDDDLVRRKFRRTTLPSAARNRECPQCKCRDYDSFDRHRSFDELIHRIKFQDWAENTIEKDREENTLKHFHIPQVASCNGNLVQKSQSDEPKSAESGKQNFSGNLLAPNPRGRCLSGDSGYSGTRSASTADWAEKQNFTESEKSEHEIFGGMSAKADSTEKCVTSVCGSIADFRLAQTGSDLLAPAKEGHYRFRHNDVRKTRATSPLFDRGSVVCYTKNEAVRSYITIHHRKSSGEDKNEEFAPRKEATLDSKPKLLRQKCVIAPSIVITPHSPRLSRTPNETSTETYASFLSDSDMDDRLPSFGSDITKQNVIPRTGTSQVEPVTSETELSCVTTSTAKIEESEQIEERWFSESLETPCETQSVTKRRRRKVDVAENRGKKLSVFGNLFSRWFPQNSGAANKSKCQFHYDVTLRKHMCHCDCHRYSLPLTRKELKRKIEQNRAPSRSGSLSYRMENLSRKGGISPMAQRSFDSIGSTVTPLQSKQRNKELNDSYCYARDSFC